MDKDKPLALEISIDYCSASSLRVQSMLEPSVGSVGQICTEVRMLLIDTTDFDVELDRGRVSGDGLR